MNLIRNMKRLYESDFFLSFFPSFLLRRTRRRTKMLMKSKKNSKACCTVSNFFFSWQSKMMICVSKTTKSENIAKPRYKRTSKMKVLLTKIFTIADQKRRVAKLAMTPPTKRTKRRSAKRAATEKHPNTIVVPTNALKMSLKRKRAKINRQPRNLPELTHPSPPSKDRLIRRTGPNEMPCRTAISAAIPKRFVVTAELFSWCGVNTNQKTAAIVAVTAKENL